MIALVISAMLAVPPSDTPQGPPRFTWAASVWKAPEVTTRTVVGHQYSASHTHACANQNCDFKRKYGEPYVWNHATNASHNCPYCGTQQLYVSGRPVTALKTIQVQAAPPPAPTLPAPRAAVPVTTIFQGYSAVSSNCANGQCSTVTRGRSR